MKTRAVIFDLFHTLISLKTDGVEGQSTSEILGVPEQAWNTLLFEHSEKRLRGCIKNPTQIIKELVEKGGWDISDSSIAKAAKAREARFAKGMKAVKPHVLKTLDRLRDMGWMTALCSNADWMERKGWGSSPLATRFNAAVFSCDVGYLKPEKDIYQITLKRLKVEPQEVVFVGDGGSNELLGARQMGMQTVLITEILSRLWPALIEQRKESADHVITHIEQIIEYLQCNTAKN